MSSNLSEPVSLVMVAIGGYGYYYLRTLLDEFSPNSVEIRAVVDPAPEKSEAYSEISRRQIPIFQSLRDFYQEGGSSDLTVISSPIHFHVPQSCEALRRGSHVLCDKPIGVTVQEVDDLIRTMDEAERWVMVGYQWSFTDAIQALKRDILKGVWGYPVRLKTLCLWPRDESYYSRNDWAGKQKDPEGRWILDNPANNAMAHFLHNLFYILGETMDTSAKPVEVTAECYRTNAIDTFDTIGCRIFTEGGTECLFYASHAIPEDLGPMFSFEFEDATVTYGGTADDIIAIDARGREKHYGSPNDNHQFRKLFEAVETVKHPKSILCGPEAARSQTLCVNGIQESVSEIIPFPEAMMLYDEKRRLHWVKGLSEHLYECYQTSHLPSETGVSWARRGGTINLSHYRYFPGGMIPGT